MAYRKPTKKPEFADLKGILAQTKSTENPEYQTIQELIERLTLFKNVLDGELARINNNFAPKTATYLTRNDETSNLPNSVQIQAGTGVTLDYSTPGKVIVNAAGGMGNGYWAPLTDGDPIEANLIFTGFGECVMVWLPT